MKKMIFAFAVVTLLLQSCSTGKMFHKKRYGHLNWIDRGYKMDDPKDSKITDVVMEEETTTDIPAFKEEIKTTSLEKEVKTTVVEIEHETTIPVAEPKSPAVTTTDALEIEYTESTENSPSVAPKNESIITAPAKPQMDEDVKLIVCLILAIIIPPLGMYVWDQNTDMWFVIDLVLFLFWAFFILGYGWGLAALTSVVIAILRVVGLL